MAEAWHNAFNPERFLKRVDLDSLLGKNNVDPDSEIPELRRPCLICNGSVGPGIVLNEGSYLCRDCFQKISRVQYPEIYENARRAYLAACSARAMARESMLQKSWQPKASFVLFGGFALLVFTILLTRDPLSYPGVLAVVLFVAGYWVNSNFTKKIEQWDRLYLVPQEPVLKHFHDPTVQLTPKDRHILYVFSHWPGYPPFWDYLRELVKGGTGIDARSQVVHLGSASTHII
jgi:hypothetical protein